MGRLLRAALFWLGLPGDFHWWWTVGYPFVGSTGIAAVMTFVREAPAWQVILAFIAVYIAVLIIGVPIRRKWFASGGSAANGGSGSPINIGHVQHFHQSPNRSTKPEREPLPPRYRRDETIRLADFWRENAEIESGQEVIRHWMFQKCRILGPAVLFVQEPNKPTNFIECEWEEGEGAFSVKLPKAYSGNVEIVRLFHTKFIGCLFTRVEIAVSQETYERYKRGEDSL